MQRKIEKDLKLSTHVQKLAKPQARQKRRVLLDQLTRLAEKMPGGYR